MNNVSLEHTLTTISYRTAKVLRDMPEEATRYRPAEGVRTPIEILAHMSDLFDWALSIANGQQAWQPVAATDWDSEVTRFFGALERFRQRVKSDEPVSAEAERLFQGPIADALTHTGQLAMLRRMAGSPIKSENFFRAAMKSNE